MEEDTLSESFDVQKEIQQIENNIQNNSPELLDNIDEPDKRELIGMVAEAWQENEDDANLDDATNSATALLKVVNRQYVRKTDITNRKLFANSAARFMNSSLADKTDENGFSHKGTLRPTLKDLNFEVIEPSSENEVFQVTERE